MTNVLTGGLDAELRNLNAAIQGQSVRAQEAHAHYESVLDRYRGKDGKLPKDILRDPIAGNALVDASELVDAAKERLATLTARKAKLLDQFVDDFDRRASSITGSHSDGGLRLSFGPDDLRSAYDQIRRRLPVRIGDTLSGPMAAIDGTSFPQGAVAEYRIGDVFPYLREVPIVANLFPVEITERDSVVVYKTTSPAAAAAPVATGSTKPESHPEWDPVTVQTETIAHIATVDNKIVADYTGWDAVVGREMMAGLLAAIDDQILNGDGSSPHLRGLAHTVGIGTVTQLSEFMSEALHRAMTAVRTNVFANATAIVLHPSDLETIRFEKASGSGEFVNGDPVDGAIGSLWGIPVLPTTATTIGTAWVLNPALAGRLIVRQSPVLEINPWSETEWKKNELSLRNEARLGFAVVNAGAICKVTLASLT